MTTTEQPPKEALSPQARRNALARLDAKGEPNFDCARCPRLRGFLTTQKISEPGWWNGPVPTWRDETAPLTDVRLLIIGLAPGMKGANRTSRPFVGDWSGAFLHNTLLEHRFAEGQYASGNMDQPILQGTAITNAVRCLPPHNKPVAAEINACREFLVPTIARFTRLKLIVTLGAIAHQSTMRALGERLKDAPFGHNKLFEPATGPAVLSSYHCSRYNTNTGVLTQSMFNAVFARAMQIVDGNEPAKD